MQPKISSLPNLVKELPTEVKIMFEIFGDEIRLVGGAVRDLLLGKKVNDFDFATRYLPQETTKILEKNKIKAVPTGVKFGTITAVVNGKNFEVTTLRKDSETDGRHCSPEFVDDYFLDAQRRDFTVNALYLDLAGLVTDYFDGISDLENKKVRFIGDANKRIEEDYLRILRFFRFSCGYASELDEQGLAACEKHKENLGKLSRERIRAEFLKMIGGKKKQNIIAILEVFESTKIAGAIFSVRLNIEALKNLFEIEEKLEISADLNLKLAALFCDEDLDLKSFFQEICATNAEKKYFEFAHGAQYKAEMTSEREMSSHIQFSSRSPLSSRLYARIYYSDLKKLLASQEKELVASFYLLCLAKNYKQDNLEAARETLTFLNNFTLPTFPLKSEDLIALGITGKNLGIFLQKAKEIWVENDFKIDKNELIATLKK